MPRPGNTRVNEIDLLRFCAAMAVVFYHYTFRGFAADGLSPIPYPALAPVAKYGYLGVELFFMISGFVILMTAAHGSLKAFIVSRLVRLYPAFWACCTLTFVTITLIGTTAQPLTLREYVINMTMTSGFVGVRDLDGSYWSLFVEMRFYALVAIVLLLRRIQQAQWLLVCWLGASAASVLLDIDRLRAVLIVDYSAFFIAGAACFLIWSRGISRVTGLLILGSWLMAIWQSTAALPEIEKHYATDLSAVIIGMTISTFFLVMVAVAMRLTGPFANREWTIVGTMTYPLYLLHQSIGFSIFNAAYPSVHPQVLLWGTIAAMLATSYAVHVWIEQRAVPKMRPVVARWLEVAELPFRRVIRSPDTEGAARAGAGL